MCGLGDSVTLDINNKEANLCDCGHFRGALTGANIFMNYPYFSRHYQRCGASPNLAGATGDRSAENQMALGQHDSNSSTVTAAFVSSRCRPLPRPRTIISTVFDVIIIFLLAMAVLLGFVGGLGLMGTMSINVLERTQKLGSCAPLARSDRAVLNIVMVEGVLIGVISWAIGGLTALPASSFLTNTVGTVLLQAKPSYIFSTNGALLWLVIVILLAALASYLPGARPRA